MCDTMKKALLTATVQSHIAQFHKPLIRILKKKGYEVHVAARNNLAEKNGLRIEGADEIYDLPFSRSPKSPDNIKAYQELKKIIQENKYEIIQCNTPVGGIITRLAARKARKAGTKVYYTAHGFHFYQGAPIKNWLIFYPIEKFFARYTDKLVTITKEDDALAKKRFSCEVRYMHGVGVDGKRYKPISDTEKAVLRKEMNYDEDAFLCLCTGELNKNKNQSFLLDLMPDLAKMVPTIKLLLAGNGPYENTLREKARENGIEEHVEFLGYTTQLEKYVGISDVVCSASMREGMPLNIIEAMLCRKPIVATVNRGHRELIQNEQNGCLIPQGDAEAFRRAVQRFYQDACLRNRLGEQACIDAAAFGVCQVEKELEDIYGD